MKHSRTAVRRWLIVGAIVFFLLTALGLYIGNWRAQREQDPHYHIVALMQRANESASLPTHYLAEMMGLSIDHPVNLYCFSLEEGQKQLLAHPVIASAKVKRVPPGVLFVDYQLVKPLAFLGECANGAVDSEGVLFPYVPFFSSKKLPLFFLGIPIDGFEWGQSIAGKRFLLGKKLLAFLLDEVLVEGEEVMEVDLSMSEALSAGRKEVVVKLNLVTGVCFLRLPTDDYESRLEQLQLMRKDLKKLGKREEPIVVDLRLPNLGYLIKLKENPVL